MNKDSLVELPILLLLYKTESSNEFLRVHFAEIKSFSNFFNVISSILYFAVVSVGHR